MHTPEALAQLDHTMLLLGLCEAYRDMSNKALPPAARQAATAEHDQLRAEALRRMAGKGGMHHPQEPFAART